MRRLIAIVALIVASATFASAQAPASSAREDLSSLPESQAILFVNTRRITNEVLPRVVPAEKYQGAFDEAKRMANIDLREIDYLLAGVRLTDAPSSGTVPAEFGLIVRGGFNADALLSFVRLSQPGQYRDETRAGKTITIFKVSFDNDTDKDKGAAANKDAATAPKSELPSEIAAVALTADSLLIGTPGYVAAALDARTGASTRVKPELVALALANQDALVSIAGELPPSVSKYLDSPGDKAMTGDLFNEEMKRLIDSVRQVQLSLNMNAAQYGAQVTLRTDMPENARAISGLVAAGVNAAEEEARKAAAAHKGRVPPTQTQLLGLLRSLTNSVRDNELLLSISVPQTTAAAYAHQMFAPTPAPKKATARKTTRRGRKTTRRKA
ncbi:MAG: hypothetical protein QOF61_70 [Acidobacteriota bacterium]|jgi:hypothetical protein|nr:hypothetical protein [Acidobacteriota bacterium]